MWRAVDRTIDRLVLTETQLFLFDAEFWLSGRPHSQSHIVAGRPGGRLGNSAIFF